MLSDIIHPALKNLIQSEIRSEIDPANLWICHNLGGISFLQDTAIMKDIRPVHDGECLSDIVIGDQHAQTPRLEVCDKPANLAHSYRIDPGEGLVKQDIARIGRECACNLYPPPLAAR